MRALTLFSMCLVVALVSCKSHKPVAVQPGEAADIPREVAVQKLGELLPTTEYVYCSAPKESLKPGEITLWKVVSDSVQIEFSKGRKLQLSFADIVDVKLELTGKYYTVKVYTTVQVDRARDHFQFLWKVEDRAKQVTELLLSLKKK
jgi:hypothetical protein